MRFGTLFVVFCVAALCSLAVAADRVVDPSPREDEESQQELDESVGMQICGMNGKVLELSTSSVSHAPGAVPFSECVLASKVGFPDTLQVTVVGPSTASPLRNTTVVPAVGHFFNSLSEFISDPASVFAGPWKVVRALISSLRIFDFLATFATPSAWWRLTHRTRLTFIFKYYKHQHHFGDSPVTIYRYPSFQHEAAGVVCERTSNTYIPAAFKHWWNGEELLVASDENGRIIEQCTVSVPATAAHHYVIALRRQHNSKDILRNHPLYSNGDGPIVQTTVEERLDTWSFKLLFALIVVKILGPILVQNMALQLAVAFIFGLLIILIVVIYLLVKDLQSTWIGKLGIVSIIGVGGFAAAGEGILSAVFAYFVKEVQTSPIMQVALLLCGALASAVCYYYLREHLSTAARVILLGVEKAIVLWAIYDNVEFVVGCFFVRQLLRFTARFGRLPIRLPNEDEPSDIFPQYVYNGGEYRQPRIATAITGKDIDEKMKKYEETGVDYTQKELRKLAEYIRQNTSELSRTVQNPNQLVRFAGSPARDDE